MSTILNSCKEDLLKYCYLGSSSRDKLLKQALESYIRDCKNVNLLQFCHAYFMKLIKPYFDVNRTKFNKLRRFFML
jgi:hypothetical protein